MHICFPLLRCGRQFIYVGASHQDTDAFLGVSMMHTWFILLPLAAGEPELAVAPHVLKAPVHVYTPGRPFKRLTAYGDTYGESAPPVCVLFYGQHYDALVDLDKKPGAARSRGPSSRKRSRDPPSDHLSGQNF
jgi:hypothetical protein